VLGVWYDLDIALFLSTDSVIFRRGPWTRFGSDKLLNENTHFWVLYSIWWLCRVVHPRHQVAVNKYKAKTTVPPHARRPSIFLLLVHAFLVALRYWCYEAFCKHVSLFPPRPLAIHNLHWSTAEQQRFHDTVGPSKRAWLVRNHRRTLLRNRTKRHIPFHCNEFLQTIDERWARNIKPRRGILTRRYSSMKSAAWAICKANSIGIRSSKAGGIVLDPFQRALYAKYWTMTSRTSAVSSTWTSPVWASSKL